MFRGLPIILNVTSCRCVIIGGGRVAARKARALVHAGATDVRVVAKRFLAPFPTNVQRTHRAYRESDLAGAGLVFAATDQADINNRIVADARRAGAIVSRVDQAESGDFLLPATARRGGMTISISTGTPRLSKRLLNNAVESIDLSIARYAKAVEKLRPELKAQGARAAMRRLATDSAVAAFERGGVPGLKNFLQSARGGRKVAVK